MNRQFYNWVMCADGFTMSIQGSHWESGCEPMEDGLDDSGEYLDDFNGFSHLEVQLKGGFEPLFYDYVTKGCQNCGGNYQGHKEYSEPLHKVPIQLIFEVIMKHGGMIQGHMPKFDEGWLAYYENSLKANNKHYMQKKVPWPKGEYGTNNSFDPQSLDSKSDYKTGEDLIKEEKQLGRMEEE